MKHTLPNGREIIVRDYVFDLDGPDTPGMAPGYVPLDDFGRPPQGPYKSEAEAVQDADRRLGGLQPLGAIEPCPECGDDVEIVTDLEGTMLFVQRVVAIHSLGTGVIARRIPIGVPPEYGAFVIIHREVCRGRR